VLRLLVAACVVPSSPIFITLVMDSPKCRSLQEPHGVTSQKTPFFIVTAVKTSNLFYVWLIDWLFIYLQETQYKRKQDGVSHEKGFKYWDPR
jgi:hypothetical protein